MRNLPQNDFFLILCWPFFAVPEDNLKSQKASTLKKGVKESQPQPQNPEPIVIKQFHQKEGA
jgi:hypothetical protein